MIAYTLTNNSITVVLNNKVYTVSNGQPQWEPVLEAIRNDDEKALYNVLSVANTITSFTEGNVTVKDNQVFYRNVPLDNYVVEKVIEFTRNKLPLQPILRFINNLMKNPSRSAVQELYKFLEHKHMPITPDGNFLAYKGVQSDYYSKTAGTIVVIKGKVKDGRIYNGIGEEIEVERNGVCDNRSIDCSAGLHAGSERYAVDFGRGGKVVIVEINPADVVSVPDDCECQKLRTCKYKVVGEYQGSLDNHYNNSYSSEDWNEDAGDDIDDDEFDDESNDELYRLFSDGSDEEPEEQCQCEACIADLAKDHYSSQFENKPTDNATLKREATQKVSEVLTNTADTLRAFAEKLAKSTNPAPAPTPSKDEQLTQTITSALDTLKSAIAEKFKK